MGYSCSDFTDDVFAELHRVGAITEAEYNDEDLSNNASLQADYAFKGIGRLVEVRDAAAKARQFMEELLDSVETLTGIADLYGARTLADLMYLHSAVVSGGFIDYYPGESCVLDVIKPLPSGDQWVQYVKVEHLSSAETPEVTAKDIDAARSYGFQVHQGSNQDDSELIGRWWWTAMLGNGSSIEAASGSFGTEAEVWADAVRQHREFLAEDA